MNWIYLYFVNKHLSSWALLGLSPQADKLFNIFSLTILSTNAVEQKKIVTDFWHGENIHCNREIFSPT